MRTQHVDYAVWDRKLGACGLPGTTGYTDKARFILHFLNTAYLFGEHEGRTLVVEFITSGFLLRFRVMQTAEPPKADREVYGHHRGEPIHAPSGWVIISEGQEIPQEHREYVAQEHGLWCQWRRCHSTMTPPKAKLWGDVRAYAARDARLEPQET
jgi:hypothetical protein